MPAGSVGGVALNPERRSRQLTSVTAFPKGGTPRHESISPALLAYYYEHFREQRRPADRRRDEKRESFDRNRPSHSISLNRAWENGKADRLLKTDLAQLPSGWILGTPPDLMLVKSLREHATQSSVTAETLLEAARGVQWLIGETAATLSLRRDCKRLVTKRRSIPRPGSRFTADAPPRPVRVPMAV